MSTQRSETATRRLETKTPWVAFWNALLAGQGIIAYTPIIAVNIFMFSVASWQFLWLKTDPARYQCYALTYWLGSNGAKLLPATQCSFLPISTFALPPLHMLPLEYPPLAVAIFTVPLFFPLLYYQMIFAVLMALFSAFIYWLLLHYGPRGAALAFAFYLFMGSWALALERFDLVPAALTLLCLMAAERKYWTLAYIVLAFGFLLKIYPILFLPALFIAEQQATYSFQIPTKSLPLKALTVELWHTLRGIHHWRWKNIVFFFGILLAITGFFALFDFKGAVISQLSYFASRPIQVESTASILLWLATLFGIPVHIAYTFGSINMVSSLGGVVSNLFEVLFIVAYIYAIYLQWRGKLDIVQTCIALLLVFIVTGKVFSPQYLIWIIPLLAYAGAFDRSWLVIWGSISLLTTIIYPYFYTRTIDSAKIAYFPGFIQFVTARNFLFIVLTFAYLFNWFHIRRRKVVSTLENPQDDGLQPLIRSKEK